MSTQTPETSRTINGITYTLGEEVLIELHTCWERNNKIEIATVAKITPRTIVFSDGTRIKDNRLINKNYGVVGVRPRTEADKVRGQWESDVKTLERMMFKYSEKFNDHTATFDDKIKYANTMKYTTEELVKRYDNIPEPIKPITNPFTLPETTNAAEGKEEK